MTTLMAYIGRDNEERLELLEDDALVAAGVVTRAVFKFDSWVLDTDVDTDVIYFDDANNQTLCLKLGQITDMEKGMYRGGKITLYDIDNVDGIAWGDPVTVIAITWPVTLST